MIKLQKLANKISKSAPMRSKKAHRYKDKSKKMIRCYGSISDVIKIDKSSVFPKVKIKKPE
jgi:hypothetical protein